jgi:1-acyl-sn-glycerol-3-phosphate acyltransferase
MTPAYAPTGLAIAQGLGRIVFGTAFRLEVLGRELVPDDGPVLLAGNHTGFLDGPMVVVHAPRRVRALTKAELYRGPLGAALDFIGQIPVHRGLPDRAALTACEAELTRGGAVAIFPEGTRGAGDLRRVHRGVGWLALRTGVPIVPVACVGTAQALPKGSHRPAFRAPVTVAYGAPFTVPAPDRPRSSAVITDVTEHIRQRLANHLATVVARHHSPGVTA